jgi:hypothetical protein
MIRLPNGQQTLSVGELREALSGLPDSLPVDVFVEKGNPDGYNVIEAKRHPASGISYETFSLHVREGFYF